VLEVRSITEKVAALPAVWSIPAEISALDAGDTAQNMD